MSGGLAPAPTKTRSDVEFEAWLAGETQRVAAMLAADALPAEPASKAAPADKPQPKVPKEYQRALKLLRGSLEQGDLAAAWRLTELLSARLRAACPAGEALGSLAADDLMRQELSPTRWVIDDLLPVGVTVLAGAPKSGKSLLALDLAVGVARGEPVLGRAPTRPGAVLFLGLEDGPGRLQERLGRWGAGSCAGLSFRFGAGPRGVCGWPRLDQGGLDALRRYHDAEPRLTLVVVDVLACIRPARQRGESAYDADFLTLHELGTFGFERDLAVLAVHHTRKTLPGAAEGDVFEGISGTTGLFGAVDGALLLKRKRFGVEGSLLMTGRDREEAALDLRFDPERVRWELGPAAAARDADLTGLQRQILDAVESTGSLPVQELYRNLPGSSPGSIRKVADRLVERGLLRKADRATYNAVTTVTTVTEGTESVTPVTVVTPVTADAPETSDSTSAARGEVRP